MEILLTTLSYFFWVALALSILVFIHEMGHFLTARMFGMRVDAFSLGMPPNIFRKQWGETEYRIGALPLGGYVKIAGMIDESMDMDGLESEPQPDEFRSKPVWQRMIVISAGVVFNVVLAVLIYSALAFAYGQTYTPAENVTVEVVEGSIADDLGFETGDRVYAVDGEPVRTFEEFLPALIGNGAESITVKRDGGEATLAVPSGMMTRISRASRASDEDSALRLFGALPEFPALLGSVQSGSAAAEAGLRTGDRILSIDGQPVRKWMDLTALVAQTEGEATPIRWARPLENVAAGDPEPLRRTEGAAIYEAEIAPRANGDGYVLGVVNDQNAFGTVTETLGFGASLQAGADQTATILNTYVGFIGKLFTGQESFKENVGGPIEIARQSKQMADRGWPEFWGFVAFLSIALAVFNILPIPALDGGHIMFLIYEAIARREPSLKVRMVVQQVGLALILALMVFVIFNDTLRLFG
ncbi:MAG: RIP metalloprotease RseP [Rubricoccaceae bacterium]